MCPAPLQPGCVLISGSWELPSDPELWFQTECFLPTWPLVLFHLHFHVTVHFNTGQVPVISLLKARWESPRYLQAMKGMSEG